MADNQKQQTDIEFGGQTYQVRPDFDTLVAIEAATDQASRSLGMKCLRSEISLAELGIIMFVMLKGKPNAPKKEDVGPILVENGYGHLLLPVGEFLTRAQQGNKEHEKEVAAKPAASNPPTGG